MPQSLDLKIFTTGKNDLGNAIVRKIRKVAVIEPAGVFGIVNVILFIVVNKKNTLIRSIIRCGVGIAARACNGILPFALMTRKP